MKIGILYNGRSADQAVVRLCGLVYTLRDINVLMNEQTCAKKNSDIAVHTS
jgi:hypothetical protein